MMQPLANQYAVSRPVYSEDAFVNQYQKIARHHKSQLDHVKEYLTCDSKRAKNAALSLFPFIGWMRIYRIKEWLLSDMLSGVSTGLVAVLQGLAFSLLAELPASYGLFTAFFPVLVYFFLGTSRHISVGSFPVLSLMVGTVVTRIVPGESPEANITTTTITIPGFEGLTLEQQRVVVAASVTFLMGVFQLAMGVLQVGFIVMYLSDTLISGFTTAAAIHILVSQLKFVLALPVKCPNGPLAIICNLEQIFSQITDTNIADLVISIIIILVVFVVKELNDKFKAKLPVPIPIEVIVTIVVCGLSYGFNFEEKFGVEVLGQMQSGYEAPMAPNSEVLQMSAVEAFPMAIVGFAVAFSVAKVYSIKHDYIIDGNQELIAFGVSNIFGASFRSFAASTALSRSAVQESTGGKTQVAGLISAMMAMIVTMWIGFLLEPLPKSVLGALVVVNLKGMLMQFREIPYLWRKDRPDCKAKTPDHWSWSEMLHLFTRLSESNFGETRVLAMMVTSMVAPVVCPILTFAQVVWIATCILAVLLGLDLGLAAGVGVELLTVVIRTQFNRCCVLANIKGTDIYKDRKDYLNVYEPEGVKIFRIPAPIFFANIEFFKGKLIESVGFNPLRILRKRNKALRKIKKLLKNGELQITEKGLLHTGSAPIEESEDESNMEELDQPIDFKNLPIQVNWNAELPANICVPKVDIHSVILDFAAVSFLDISALKGLKTILKEFIRVDVAVYIVACDVYILEKLHSCKFFDDEIKTSIFFLTLHDAVLYILEKHPEQSEGRLISDKDFFQNHLYKNSVPCLRSRDKGDAESRL